MHGTYLLSVSYVRTRGVRACLKVTSDFFSKAFQSWGLELTREGKCEIFGIRALKSSVTLNGVYV